MVGRETGDDLTVLKNDRSSALRRFEREISRLFTERYDLQDIKER
jgi:hypothetical protein